MYFCSYNLICVYFIFHSPYDPIIACLLSFLLHHSFISLQVPGLLGDPSWLLLQKVLGLRTPAPVPLGKGLLGDSPTGELLVGRSSSQTSGLVQRSHSLLQGKTFAMQILKLFESPIISSSRQPLQSVFLPLYFYTDVCLFVCAKSGIGIHQSIEDLWRVCLCAGSFLFEYQCHAGVTVR